MKIRATTAFNDRQNGYVTRPANEVFECSEQRTKKLIDGGFAEEVKPDAPKKPRAKAVGFTVMCCNILYSIISTKIIGNH